MSKTLRGIGNATLNVQNKSVNGLRFAVQLQAAVANTPIVNPNTVAFVPSNVKVLVNLMRAGKKHRIAESTLDVLAREGSIRNAGWDVIAGTQNLVLRAAAAGVFERRLLPYEINFHSGIVLRGDDTLEVQLQTNGSTYAAAMDQTNSQIEFSEIQCDCEEYGIPKFDIRAVNTGDNIHNVQMADNVKSVTFVNLNATDVLEANAVISTVNISGPDINANLSYWELLAQRNNDLEFVAGAVANTTSRAQSFVICEGNDLDDLNVTINLNSAAVLGAQNWVVVRYLETDPITIELASFLILANSVWSTGTYFNIN
jgi:hypothetical protein